MKRYLRVKATVLLLVLLLGSNWTELRAQEPFSQHPSVPQGATSADWVFETVEPSKQFQMPGDHYLVLDASGSPRIAYGSQRFLYYAHYDGAAWQIESVDTSAPSFLYASLALDSAGRPHISYYSSAAEEVRYAHYDGTAWQIETVDSMAVPYSGYTSLALDAADHPHISYCGDKVGELRYAHFDGTAWQTETVDYVGDPHRSYTSLALDSSGRPHVAYSTGGGTAYAYYNGTSWQKEIIDPNSGISQSLLLDSTGRPHVAYTNRLDDCIKYARYDGTTWQTMTVECTDSSDYISLALSSSSLPCVAYGSGYSDLRYAQYDGTTWQIESVGSEQWYGYTSLALDSSGHPRIAFLSVGIQYIEYDGLAWQTEQVDYSEVVGSGSSLALDSANRPRVSYIGTSFPSSLKYAYYDGRAWQIQHVDTDVDSAATSLVLDTADRPHIAYWGNSPGTLRYAYHDGTTWQLATVDYVRCPGDCDLALALDLFGRPHIAYRGYWAPYTAGLKYAYYDGVQWRTEVVDDVDYEYNSYDLSIAINAVGQPSISYSDSGTLKYAQYRDGGWQIETIGVGSHTSLVLDAAGRPYLSYQGDEGLAYAYYDGTGWQEREVDNDLYGVEDTSLALDTQGQLHISYVQIVCIKLCIFYSLRYASQSEGRWLFYPVTADAFAPAPLVLDPAGWPHLVYRSGGGIEYASLCEPLTRVDVDGPARLPAGIAGAFVAAYQPTLATPPTFTWDNGSAGPAAAYSWPQPGTYTVTANVGNGCSEIAGSTSVEVFCQPLQSLSIAGPQAWIVGPPVEYRVAAEPITASLPLTVTWDMGAVGATAVYTWTEPGTFTVSLAAANLCTRLEATLAVRVLDGWPHSAYLPVITREQFADSPAR